MLDAEPLPTVPSKAHVHAFRVRSGVTIRIPDVGRIPGHVFPECPGSIHEGGELGYSLSHAFGAAFKNPALMAACVVGNGDAEAACRTAKMPSAKCNGILGAIC